MIKIITKKRYNELIERIAELKQQVKYQQFTIEMCKKIDTSTTEIKQEIQSARPDQAAGTG